jgi:hypothetical protein
MFRPNCDKKGMVSNKLKQARAKAAVLAVPWQ